MANLKEKIENWKKQELKSRFEYCLKISKLKAFKTMFLTQK